MTLVFVQQPSIGLVSLFYYWGGTLLAHTYQNTYGILTLRAYLKLAIREEKELERTYEETYLRYAHEITLSIKQIFS